MRPTVRLGINRDAFGGEILQRLQSGVATQRNQNSKPTGYCETYCNIGWAALSPITASL